MPVPCWSYNHHRETLDISNQLFLGKRGVAEVVNLIAGFFFKPSQVEIDLLAGRVRIHGFVWSSTDTWTSNADERGGYRVRK